MGRTKYIKVRFSKQAYTKKEESKTVLSFFVHNKGKVWIIDNFDKSYSKFLRRKSAAFLEEKVKNAKRYSKKKIKR